LSPLVISRRRRSEVQKRVFFVVSSSCSFKSSVLFPTPLSVKSVHFVICFNTPPNSTRHYRYRKPPDLVVVLSLLLFSPPLPLCSQYQNPPQSSFNLKRIPNRCSTLTILLFVVARVFKSL